MCFLSARKSPYALVRDGEWKPEEADDERSATRLPDGVFPEPFKYIRVWRSGLTRWGPAGEDVCYSALEPVRR